MCARSEPRALVPGYWVRCATRAVADATCGVERNLEPVALGGQARRPKGTDMQRHRGERWVGVPRSRLVDLSLT